MGAVFWQASAASDVNPKALCETACSAYTISILNKPDFFTLENTAGTEQYTGIIAPTTDDHIGTWTLQVY